MTSTRETLNRIDTTLNTVTTDPISQDAMRWQAAAVCAAVLVPADLAEPIRLVDLGHDPYVGARQAIGCDLLEKLTVDGAGTVSTDLIFDEEGGPTYRESAVLNQRATELVHVLKMAQFTGEYPAPANLSKTELAFDAMMWRRSIRLFGAVVIVGADERTGEWVPAPAHLLEFATDAFGIDLAAGCAQQPCNA